MRLLRSTIVPLAKLHASLEDVLRIEELRELTTSSTSALMLTRTTRATSQICIATSYPRNTG